MRSRKRYLYPVDNATGFPKTLIFWIMIYLVDSEHTVGSVIHLSNNWGQPHKFSISNYRNECTSITGGKIPSLKAGLEAG